MPTTHDARERLIVALDVPAPEAALKLISQLEGQVSFYKVGLELYTAAGPDFVRALTDQGLRVFLDLKFLDIGETVLRATRQAVRLGATFLSVHESGDTVASALLGAKGSKLKVLAVTVLTSMDDADLQQSGIRWNVEELVQHRATRAIQTGCDGVIASPQEAHMIRKLGGEKLIIVTPGIRPSGTAANDQKRATTPAEAIATGADYLVVGRPIRDAANPRTAAEQILAEMQQAAAQHRV